MHSNCGFYCALSCLEDLWPLQQGIESSLLFFVINGCHGWFSNTFLVLQQLLLATCGVLYLEKRYILFTVNHFVVWRCSLDLNILVVSVL